MIVRRAVEADIPKIVRLKAQLMATGWPWEVDVAGDAQWARRCAAVARELLASPRYAAFVVPRTDDETPGAPLAAMVSVAVEQHLPGPRGSGLSSYIADMSTDPDRRGEGLGSRLLEHAMQWARERGASRVELYSTELGRGVYERAGFEAGGPFAHLSRAL